MSALARFCLNLFAPAPIASLLFAFGFCIAGETFEPLLGLPIFLLVAYLYAGIPSLAHACILHVAYRRGVDPKSAGALALSTLNGLLAGTAIVLFIAIATGDNAVGALWCIMLAMGAVTGALNALLHRVPRRRRGGV